MFTHDEAQQRTQELAQAETTTRQRLADAEAAAELVANPAFVRGIERFRAAIFEQFEEICAVNSPEADEAVTRLRWSLHMLNSFSDQFRNAAANKNVEVQKLLDIDAERSKVEKFFERFKAA